MTRTMSFILLAIVTIIVSVGNARPVRRGPVCPAGAIYCEDFEGAQLQRGKLEGNASVVSSRIPGRAGSNKALHLTPVGGEYARLLVGNLSTTIAHNSMWGRLYLRVKKYPDAPNYAHWVVTELLSADESGERIRPLNGQLIDEVGAGTNMWGVGSDGGATGDWTMWRESAKVVEDTWQCLEFQVENSCSSVRIYIDGKNQPDLDVSRFNHGGVDANTTALVFPKFDKIWFGWWNFQDNTTPHNFDVYIDDIAIAPHRVRC